MATRGAAWTACPAQKPNVRVISTEPTPSESQSSLGAHNEPVVVENDANNLGLYGQFLHHLVILQKRSWRNWFGSQPGQGQSSADEFGDGSAYRPQIGGRSGPEFAKNRARHLPASIMFRGPRQKLCKGIVAGKDGRGFLP
jgi:hypothetical protein